jgi:hypothetical protein
MREVVDIPLLASMVVQQSLKLGGTVLLPGHRESTTWRRTTPTSLSFLGRSQYVLEPLTIHVCKLGRCFIAI